MALISILLLIALASALLTIMLTGEDAALQRAVRLDEAARARALVRSGELSAIAALRRDGATSPEVDHAAEPWAQIADRDAPIAGGRFSLAIADATGKLDLNPLARGDAKTLERLTILAGAIDLPSGTAPRIAERLAQGPISDLGELAATGLPADALRRLAEVATALPARQPINLNAGPEVLLALLLDDPAAARALILRRTRSGMLTREDFATQHFSVPAGTAFTSSLFWVRTRATIGDTAQQGASLLERRTASDGTPQVRVLARWQGAAIPVQAPPLP